MDLRFKEIGYFFKNARIDSDLSQVELSQKLGFKTSQLVSNWERGLCAPPMNSISKMIEIFNLEAFAVVDLITQANRNYLLRQLTLQSGELFGDSVKKSASCL